jgi:hypothetical protein
MKPENRDKWRKTGIRTLTVVVGGRTGSLSRSRQFTNLDGSTGFVYRIPDNQLAG